MDNCDWEKVLIEWANCLRLTKPIQNVKNLQESGFLQSLLKLLFSESERNLDTVLAIFQLLKSSYPNYVFEDETVSSLSAVSYDDLIAFSSLLMHYTCMIDRRESLTSPLCHIQSPITQLSIKIFLEKMNNTITNKELHGIIKQCTGQGEISFRNSYNWIASGDSPINNGSPLQEFLNKTPHLRKSRFSEKDREINKLKAELELEQLEKADLQEELKMQCDRNSKLDKQLQQKASEIKQLRCEIIALENKTPPHGRDYDSFAVQRRLRSEVDTLELYISQLEKEQIQLAEEKDAACKRVKKLESECNLWQEKAVTFECSSDTLTEKSQKQEAEINMLRSHCEELTNVIEGLKSGTQTTESFIEWGGNVTRRSLEIAHSVEDLAHTVVEVQLRDVQKENSELKIMLAENLNKSNQLNEELNNCKSRYEQLNFKHVELQEMYKETNKKVSILCDTQIALEKTSHKLSKALQNLAESEKSNAIFQEQLTSLQVKLNETTAELEQSLLANKNLQTDLTEMSFRHESVNKLLEEETLKRQRLENQASALQVDLNGITNKYNSTCFELEGLIKEFNDFDNNVENHLRKIEELVFDGDESRLNFDNKISVFEKIQAQIQSNKDQDINDKKHLNDKIHAAECLVKHLESEVSKLNQQEYVSLQERQELHTKLEISEKSIHLLQNTLDEYTTKINKMNNTIHEMTVTITQLEHLKQVIEQKDTTISELEAFKASAVEDLTYAKQQICEYKHLEEQMKEINKELETQVVSLENKLGKANQEIGKRSEIEKQLLQNLEDLTTTKALLESEITQATFEIKERKRVEENHTNKINELVIVTESLKQEIFDRNNVIAEQEKQIGNHLQIIEHLNEEKYNLIKELKQAQEEIQYYSVSQQKLQEIMEETETKNREAIAGLNNKLEDSRKKVLNLEDEIKQTTVKYHDSLEEIKTIKSDKANLEKELHDKVTHYEKNINLLNATIDRLERNMAENSVQFENLTQQYKQIEEERNRRITECNALQKSIEELSSLVSLKEMELSAKTVLEEQHQQELSQIKQGLAKKRDKIEELLTEIEQLTTEIAKLKTVNDLLSKEIKEKECEYNKEIEILLVCRTTLEKKCKEFEHKNLSLREDLKRKECELTDLTENLKANIETMQKEIQNLNTHLDNRNEKVEQLTKEHNTALKSCNHEIDQLNAQILTLNSTIDSLNIKEIEYIQEIRDLKDELNRTAEQYTEALQLQQELKMENDVQIANLTENLHDIVEKYNKSEKMQVETASLLDKANGFIASMEVEKSNLEKQLTEQKASFEKSLNILRNESLQQLNVAAEEKDKLSATVSKLVNDLTSSEEQRKMNENKLLKMETVLEELEYKNTSLRNDTEILKHNYTDLEDKYNALHLMHDNYVEKSEANLATLQEEMSCQVETLIREKQLTKEKLDLLKNEYLKLEDEKKDTIKNYENLLSKSGRRIQRLQTLAVEYDAQMSVLLVTKKQMTEQCENWKKLYEESLENNDTVIKEYESKITNSKCALEILETGKETLQKECDKLVEELNSLRNLKQKEENDFAALIKQKDDEIVALQEDIRQLQINYELKTSQLSELEYKLTSANQEIDVLKDKQLKMESEKNMALEEYRTIENELEQQKELYQNTSQSCKAISDQLETLKAHKLELENHLDIYKNTENELQCLLKEYENIVVEKTQEMNSLKLIIQNNELTITELNKQIDDHLKNMSLLGSEKADLYKKLEILTSDLENVKKTRDEILENQTKIIKETETNILRAHENAEKTKTELLKKIETIEKEKEEELKIKREIESVLAKETESRNILETNILDLNKENTQLQQVYSALKCGIEKLKCILEAKPVESYTCSDLDLHSVESINKTISSVENKIIEVMEKKQSLSEEIALLEKEKFSAFDEIQQMKEQTSCLVKEKEKLLSDYELLNKEKCTLLFEKSNESKSLEDLQAKHDLLQARYEQIVEYSESNEHLQRHNKELQELVAELHDKQARISAHYQDFSNCIKKFKTEMKTLMFERAQLDQSLMNLRINLATLQINMSSLNDISSRRLIERKDNIEIIVDDVFKQSSRLSKRIGEIVCMGLQVSENTLGNVLTTKQYSANEMQCQLNIDDDIEKINDLKERASDALQQILSLNEDVKTKRGDQKGLSAKENTALHTLKTNIINTDAKTKEDEWKKKNLALKQRLTLADNAKLLLERKIKQIREENKKLTDSMKQFQVSGTVTQKELKSDSELEKIREAYACVMTEKSQLQLEIATMKNILQDRTRQLAELSAIKEAYENLLEENNKLMTEIDTVNYKRTRDREEYTRMLLKEREELNGNENKRVQEIRNEYEGKLNKMKEKMIKLYKEEVDKEMQKLSAEKSENVYLLRTMEQLKNNLKDAKLKIHETEIERDKAFDKIKQLQQRLDNYELDLRDVQDSIRTVCSSESSSSSVHSALPRGIRNVNSRYTIDPKHLARINTVNTVKPKESLMQKNTVEERRIATLPRMSGMDVIEEIRISRRTSITSLPPDIGQNLKMEDEEDDFNNKYLSDLKEGRCITAGGESNAGRMSELMWRNSLCPPHLKSSYPAETQFASPSRFKEDDIKAGLIEFDDSMSTKLLPGEKPRNKKDIGTTSYKKPGPPTPSKNGGRLSLQGSDIHPRDALREHNVESKTPKRTTPSRLKALFMGRNSSVRDNSENQQPTTPRGRRLAIFRKAR